MIEYANAVIRIIGILIRMKRWKRLAVNIATASSLRKKQMEKSLYKKIREMGMIKKMIEYEIRAKLWFEPDEDIDITSYLDNLRGIGEAEVIDVKIVKVDSDGNVIQDKK
jgi:hypothetical protein